MSNQANKELHILLATRPLSFNPKFSKLCGERKINRITGQPYQSNNQSAGILLSQLIYWYSAMRGEKFYKLNENLVEECGTTVDELKRDKKTLIEKGFITVTLEGLPAKSYYTVHMDNIEDSAIKHQLEQDSAIKHQLHSPIKHHSSSAIKHQHYITENNIELDIEIENQKPPSLPPHRELETPKKTSSAKKPSLIQKEKAKPSNPYEEECQEIILHWNATFPRRPIYVSAGWAKNYAYWRQAGYTLEQIKQAIKNIWNDYYWVDKIDLTILFRTKDKSNEPIDKIGQMLSMHQEMEFIPPTEPDINTPLTEEEKAEFRAKLQIAMGKTNNQ